LTKLLSKKGARMSHGRDAMARLMPIHPRILIAIGLAMATLTSITPLLFGLPLLTSRAPTINFGIGEPIHLPTAMWFDLGVLFVVIGVSVGMIVRLGEEVEEE